MFSIPDLQPPVNLCYFGPVFLILTSAYGNNLAHDSCMELLGFLLFQFKQFSFISNGSKRKFTSAFSLHHLETSNCWEQPRICE